MADSQAITPHSNGNPQLSVKPTDESERLPAEEDIENARQQISQTSGQIQEQLRASSDWKLWVYRYPLTLTALAG